MVYRRPEPLADSHQLEGFDCGEPALDAWLVRHARGAQASGSARVFVGTLPDRSTVVAYSALAAAQVGPSEATKRAMKGPPSQRPVPAVLLARLAVDRRHQGRGLGSSMLQDVLLRCLEAGEAVGIRVLLVHAKHDEARSWYERYGFEQSPGDPLHLMMLVKDIRRFVRGQVG